MRCERWAVYANQLSGISISVSMFWINHACVVVDLKNLKQTTTTTTISVTWQLHILEAKTFMLWSHMLMTFQCFRVQVRIYLGHVNCHTNFELSKNIHYLFCLEGVLQFIFWHARFLLISVIPLTFVRNTHSQLVIQCLLLLLELHDSN